MTISSVITDKPAVANGSTTQFPFPNKIFSATDLVVVLTDLVGNLYAFVNGFNVATGLSYTVTNVDIDTGALVTFSAAPTTGWTVDIRSAIPELQSTSIKNQGDFLPELHEEAFDRATRMIQDLLRLTYTYGIHSQDIETTPWPALPLPATRKGLALMFDPSTGLPTVGVPTTQTLTQGLIGTLLYPQTPAELAASVTPVVYSDTSGVPVIDVRRYGAVLDGSTDDYQALANAIAVAGVAGGRILIPGHMAIASSHGSVNGYLFNCGSNIQIEGLGRQTSSITITGTTTTKIFYFNNQKWFRLSHISVNGNSQGASAGDDSSAVSFNQDTSATQQGGNVVIENCYFSNFRTSYWLNFTNESATWELDGIWIRNNIFQSFSGNSINPASSGNPAACISVHGSHNTVAGLTRNVFVHHNWAECNYIKEFLLSWSNVDRVFAHHNIVTNAGQAGGNDNCICYAFMGYNDSTGLAAGPANLNYDDNFILNPRDCGVYFAGPGGTISCRHNTVIGQTSQVDTSLPKGAFAFSGPSYAEVDSNIIQGCFSSISFVPQAGSVMRAHNNTIEGVTTSGYGIKMFPQAGTVAAEISLKDNTVQTSVAAGGAVRAIYLDVRATAGVTDLIVRNNTIDGPFSVSLSLGAGDASVPNLTNVDICENTFRASYSRALMAESLTQAGQCITIARNKFAGGWGAACYMLDVASSTMGLDILDNELCNMTSGTGGAFLNGGTQANLVGNLYINVSAAYLANQQGAGGLGFNLPTWTGSLNGYVQNLAPTELGAAASKYMILGWQYDGTNAAWKQSRTLTGN